jgi:hypothetical protein
MLLPIAERQILSPYCLSTFIFHLLPPQTIEIHSNDINLSEWLPNAVSVAYDTIVVAHRTISTDPTLFYKEIVYNMKNRDDIENKKSNKQCKK